MSDDSRKTLRDKGLKIRKEVLGKKYVEAALNNRNDFNAGLQDLLNEYCWGAAWGGKALTRRERSLINLAMLTALGRTHEVVAHTRGAKNNGLTDKEIAEVFLQAAVYCGVPAAVDSFRAANPVIQEMNAEAAASAAKKSAKKSKKSKKADEKAANKKATANAKIKKADEKAANNKPAVKAEPKKADEKVASKKATAKAEPKKADEKVASNKATAKAEPKKADEKVASKKAPAKTEVKAAK